MMFPFVHGLAGSAGGITSEIAKAVIWSGDGNDDRTIGGMPFTPNLLWMFQRTGTSIAKRYSNSLRGPTKYLKSTHSTGGEITDANALQQFLSGGFEVGTSEAVNGVSKTYGAWGFLEGVAEGLDILTYVGDAVLGRTVAHNLGASPEFYIVRNITSQRDSRVYHKDINGGSSPEDWFLLFEDWAGKQNSINAWNDTPPDASNITLGDSDSSNENGDTFLAQIFRGIAGKSYFGGYTGTGSSPLAITGLGFLPSIVFTKRDNISSGDDQGSWQFYDSVRGATERNRFNKTTPEDTKANGLMSFDADGFTLGDSNTCNINGAHYVFGAWK